MCQLQKISKNYSLQIQQKQMQHQQVPADHLSIVITTSPIRSHPNTQVIDDSIDSILKQPTLALTPIYIVCDGAKVTQENKYKSGIITQDRMINYIKYKEKLRQKYGTNSRFVIIEREQRHGFAENIKFAMQKYALTKHVMIYQHDHVIQRQINFAAVVDAMRTFEKQINYITFMHSNYLKIIPKLVSNNKIKKFLVNLIGKQEGFNPILDIRQFQRDITAFFNKKIGLPLMPLNFWYDKVHIASRKYYLDVIFHEEGHYDPNRGKKMKTLSFPQDTFGHCMKFTINRNPEKILEYGAFILWDDEPIFYHQSGRAFMTEQQRQQYLKSIKEKQISQSESSQSQKQQKQEEQEEEIDISGLTIFDTN